MNGKPYRRIIESLKGAPECIGNDRTLNSLSKNLQLKKLLKSSKKGKSKGEMFQLYLILNSILGINSDLLLRP